MILDTGYRCPEMQSFGFFPFAISEDINELLNQSGFSGPVPKMNPTRPGLSGVLGEGTFYPVGVHLDQLSRLFWCVKDYNIQFKLSKISQADFVECSVLAFPELFPPITAFVYCGIGTFDGSTSAAILPGFVNSKTLTIQDYCSYLAKTGTYNANPPNICPTDIYGKDTPNKQYCVPVNPIQKFNDLLCRKSLMTWAPKQQEWNDFNTGNYKAIDSPYFMYWSQFRVTYPLVLPPYECGLPVIFDDITASMFTLSIMDSDALAYSGNSIRFASQNYIPPYSDRVDPFDCLGKSGETLTNSWGEITGYGTNPKPSGVYTPAVYNAGTGTLEYPLTGANKGSYFPFVHFQFRLRNKFEGLSRNCPINELITSIQPKKNSPLIGTLKIMDFISGSTPSADNATTIMQVPLYVNSSLGASDIKIEVEVRPGQHWVNSQGISIY